MTDKRCVAGCMTFDGGERKHHRDCPFYPESLTKLWHDREAELEAEIKRLNGRLILLEAAAKDAGLFVAFSGARPTPEGEGR